MKKCEACGKETEHLNRLRYATKGYQGIGQKLKSEIGKDIYFKDYMFCDECKRKTDSGEKSNIDLVREAEQKRGNKEMAYIATKQQFADLIEDNPNRRPE